MPVLIFIAMLLGIAVFFGVRSKKGISGSWIRFFAKGKEEGFSPRELELLRRIAIKCSIDDPSVVFSSQDQLDICIRSIVRGIKMSGESEEQGTQDFLSKLYDYRKNLELNKPQIKNGITNSRQISENQMLRVLVAGTGVFKSQVVKNTSQCLTISRPVNSKILGMSWDRQRVSIYFWREDDAGYVFDTDVLDEVFSKGISSLQVGHADSLFRTQKRKSIRVKLHRAAFLYLAGDHETPGKFEILPGLKCYLDDLSDSGCAVVVGGKAELGIRVKVQFVLDNTPISMLGTVRSVFYQEDVRRSILHVEADPLPLETRNHILGEVFGTQQDDNEEELPFRILDNEAEALGGQLAVNPVENFMEDIDV